MDLIKQSIEDLGLRRSKRNVQLNSEMGGSSVSQSGDLHDEETDSHKRKRDGKQREGEKKK